LQAKYVKNMFFVMEPDEKQLSGVTRLMDGGRFLPVLDSVPPLEKLEDALLKAESRKTRGKIVFEI
jgi:NADPH:quinone reductase-like Zn-dependent oxidoreductase